MRPRLRLLGSFSRAIDIVLDGKKRPEAPMTFTLTREQLYDLVWSEPMQRLAKQIGISDVAIAKHCRKLGVPVPERGYWNKLQAGKSVATAALPERDLVTINRVTISGALTPELRSRIKGEPGMVEPNTESIEALTERLRKRLGHVTVPRNFSRVHPAIAPLLKKDEKLRQEAANSRHSFPCANVLASTGTSGDLAAP